MSVVRRCLGCGVTSPLNAHACPKCGSHAAEVVKATTVAKSTPKPKRKT
jgi:rRNA maturation endonuclease Nob1